MRHITKRVVEEAHYKYQEWYLINILTRANYENWKLTDEQIAMLQSFSRKHRGFHEDFWSNPANFCNLPNDVQVQLVKWVEVFSNPLKNWNSKVSSYGLKHQAEDFGLIDVSYVSNEQLKGAMLLAGYKPKDPNELNWKFKASWKLPKYKQNKLRKYWFKQQGQEESVMNKFLDCEDVEPYSEADAKAEYDEWMKQAIMDDKAQ